MGVKIHAMVGPGIPDVEVYGLNTNFSKVTTPAYPDDAPGWLENSTATSVDVSTGGGDNDLQDYVGFHSYFQWSNFDVSKGVGVAALIRLGSEVIKLIAVSTSANTFKFSLNGNDSTKTDYKEGQTYRISILHDRTGSTPYDCWLYVNGVLQVTTTIAVALRAVDTGFRFCHDAGHFYDGTRRWANAVLVSGSSLADIDENNFPEIQLITPNSAGNYTTFADDGSACTADDGVYGNWDDWASGSNDGDTTYNCAPNRNDPERMTSAMTSPSGFRNSIVGVEGFILARNNTTSKSVSIWITARANSTDVDGVINVITLDTYEGRYYCFSDVPGGGDWDTDIDELEIGVKRNSDAANMFVTAIGAEVCAFGTDGSDPIESSDTLRLGGQVI